MDTLTFIAWLAYAFTILIVGSRFATAWERRQTITAEKGAEIVASQTDAIKAQVDGQLNAIREEAIREQARRDHE